MERRRPVEFANCLNSSRSNSVPLSRGRQPRPALDRSPPILKRRGAARPMNAPPRNNGADPAAARRRRPQALPPKPQEPAPIPQIILPGPEQAQAQALPDRKTQAVKDAVRPEHGRAPEANQAPSQPSIAWKPGKKRPVQPGYPTVGPRLGQGKVKTPPKEVTLGNEQYGALFDLVGDSLDGTTPRDSKASGNETSRRVLSRQRSTVATASYTTMRTHQCM